MPFPNTRVIPDGWSEHHLPVPADAMTATVTITGAAGPGTWNPTTGEIEEGDAATVYTGEARVQALPREADDPDAAGQAVSTRPYLVAIPDLTVEVDVGHRVHVDTAEDPLLVGCDLTVRDVQRGSLVWDRALTCELDAANTG